MKLIQQDKRFELSIDSYEFPFDENGFAEDNNWLNVVVEWEDEVLCEQAMSPCLSTSELQELCKGLGRVLLQDTYTSSFAEPDLTVQGQPLGDNVQIQVSYAKKGRSRFYMDAIITKEELDHIVSDLHEMCKQFPTRSRKILH